MNSKEIEELLKKNYESDFSLENFEFFLRKDQKIFISKNLPQDMVKKSMYLLHFGNLKRNGKIQLSIEGSQIIGKSAKKNVAVLDEENAMRFAEGLSVSPKELINCEKFNFVLVKFKEDFLGSGLLRDKVEPYISKDRKILTSMKKV
ncbi:MAG: hypothetical protein QW472_00800 [Candidatus Aenigmatarchaeota archaeon]